MSNPDFDAVLTLAVETIHELREERDRLRQALTEIKDYVVLPSEDADDVVRTMQGTAEGALSR